MKRTIILLIALTMFASSFAGDPGVKEASPSALTSVTGMVKDGVSGEFLTGVKVEIEGTDRVAYTDFDGKFRVADLEPGKYIITLEMISYDDKKLEDVEVGTGSDNDLIVGLDPRSLDLSINSN
jgi:hypothetical protein